MCCMCQTCRAQRQCTAALHGMFNSQQLNARRATGHQLGRRSQFFVFVFQFREVHMQSFFLRNLQLCGQIAAVWSVLRKQHIGEVLACNRTCASFEPTWPMSETRLLDFIFVFACKPTCDMSQLESLLDVEPCACELTCGRSEKSLSMILNWAWFAESTWHGTRLEQLQHRTLASWHGEHEIADTACFGQYCSFFCFLSQF